MTHGHDSNADISKDAASTSQGKPKHTSDVANRASRADLSQFLAGQPPDTTNIKQASMHEEAGKQRDDKFVQQNNLASATDGASRATRADLSTFSIKQPPEAVMHATKSNMTHNADKSGDITLSSEKAIGQSVDSTNHMVHIDQVKFTLENQIRHLLSSPDPFDFNSAIKLLTNLGKDNTSSIEPKYTVTSYDKQHVKEDKNLRLGSQKAVHGIRDVLQYKDDSGKPTMLEYFGKVAIDIDGSAYNKAIDPVSRPDTSLKVSIGEKRASLDAFNVPYVVLSHTVWKMAGGKDVYPPSTLALIEYRGKYVSAVLGDIGPKHSAGEASAFVVRKLGLPIYLNTKGHLTGGLDTPHAHYYFFASSASPGLIRLEDVTPEAIQSKIKEVIKQNLLYYINHAQDQ